ncbi:hypothetical protein, partial [Klebsiella pneumoniae]|nr:hypothetical protein [Klebsiella pneumoniae]
RVVDLPRQLSRLSAAGRRCACPAWIVTERVETARRPGKAQPPPGIKPATELAARCRAALRLPGLDRYGAGRDSP